MDWLPVMDRLPVLEGEANHSDLRFPRDQKLLPARLPRTISASGAFFNTAGEKEWEESLRVICGG